LPAHSCAEGLMPRLADGRPDEGEAAFSARDRTD